MFPVLAMASHSIDGGAFFSQHHEPGYNYDLGGISLKYEIGNSKGLKAIGKVYMSNDSDLLFLLSKSEIVYYIPLENFNLFPFFGSQILSHEVNRFQDRKGSITKSWLPVGLGANFEIEGFKPEMKISYLFPLSFVYLESNHRWIEGKHYKIYPMYNIEAKCSYVIKNGISTTLLFNWEQDFHQKQYTWIAETYLSKAF